MGGWERKLKVEREVRTIQVRDVGGSDQDSASRKEKWSNSDMILRGEPNIC